MPQNIRIAYNKKRPSSSASSNKKKTQKVSKAEISKIAKNAVKTVAEKKFMNVNQNLRQILPNRPPGQLNISGIGFSTTVADDPQGTVMLYGGTPIKEMLCLRPFRRDQAGVTSDLRAMAPDGKHITPVSCKSRFRLSRHYGITSASDTNYPDATSFPPGLANNLPVRCRMIRCTPAISSGTATELDPDGDLFQDEYGRKIGISQADMTNEDLLFYRVNTRRWRVLEDKQFDIRNPLTVNYTQMFEPGVKIHYAPQISNTNGNCEKYLSMNHQLSSRKGGKCYYSDPMADTTENADTGHRREYVFFNFVWKGGEGITGATPGGEPTREQAPIDIDIDCVNYTKFVDV